MKNSEVEKLSSPLREQQVVHLLLVKLKRGISISSLANGDDLYDFFQVMADQNPIILEIMEAVIESRRKPQKPPTGMIYN